MKASCATTKLRQGQKIGDEYYYKYLSFWYKGAKPFKIFLGPSQDRNQD